jgi:cryptochrome
MRVFDRLLLDADPALNAGNWMWLSCSAFFHQYFRVYSPVSFAAKYDKSGAYVRRWLPVLAKLPDKYIYCPWEAPESVQRAAGCVVGKDYPSPIVDHASASKECMRRMSEAFAASKEGGGGGGSGSVRVRGSGSGSGKRPAEAGGSAGAGAGGGKKGRK